MLKRVLGRFLKGLKVEAAIWCALLAVFFFASYGYLNQHTSHLVNVPSHFFDWEKKIPFISWMIVPYMSSDLIFVLCFLMMKDILVSQNSANLINSRKVLFGTSCRRRNGKMGDNNFLPFFLELLNTAVD